ncbi:MAG TPA: hypothetical protein VF223_18465 [Trebonia sp.]
MGLHLGWIPNEPGLRPRDFERPAPTEPAPDPAKVAALQAAQHAKGLWGRLLIAVGLFALVLFGLISALAHVAWGWGVAAGLALCCWLPVMLLGLNRRRAATRLRTETEQQAKQHAAELAEYTRGKAQWAQSEAERIATAPRWLQVAAHEDISRLDVFGGTGLGRQNMVTGLGWELLEHRPVIVLDLTQDRVADGLLTAAARAGISFQDYELPADLGETPLLAELSGEQIASLIVEVVHADDASATAAGRATDLMILKKIVGVLGAGVSMGRLHAALTVLLGDATSAFDAAPAGPPAEGGPLTDGERAALGTLFGDGFRRQVTGNLVRLAAVAEPLTALGTNPPPRQPAGLTCLSLAEGPRDVAADLTAALVVQWVTRAISEGGMADDGSGPAVILAGADEQSTRHLGRLTAVCERYDIPLVRTFSRLTEESARHLNTRHTAFMRLATRPEALRAAEHIGLERRFVAGRFAHRHSVSRSRTRTTSDSVTNTSGRTEGEATTHTTGTTTGQAYSEAEVPRHEQQVHVHVEDHRPPPERDDRRHDGRDEPGHRATASVREPSDRESGGAARGSDGRSDKAVRGAAEKGTGVRDAAGVRNAAERRTADPRPRGRPGGGWGGPGGSGSRGAAGGSGKRPAGAKSGKPQIDIVKTRTWFTAHHESEAKTKSWSTTEETSHTTATSRSRTDGVSVGDEITYELVYDHKVHPETLMALPEDQMLAPNIVEAAASAGQPVTGDRQPAAAESKMVALVVDPTVVGTALVAPVRPGEIPAFEPPAPAVSAQVPDYDRIPRPAALARGDDRLR